MAYRIDYGPAQPEEKSCTLRLQVLTASFLLLFVLLVKQAWPEGTAKLQEIFLPGDAHSTQTAFQELISDLQNGEGLGDAVTAFCEEIIDHAELED